MKRSGMTNEQINAELKRRRGINTPEPTTTQTPSTPAPSSAPTPTNTPTPTPKVEAPMEKGVPQESFKSTDALRKHNKVVQSLVDKYNLSKAQQRRLHDEITGGHYTREEIEDIIKNMFNK